MTHRERLPHDTRRFAIALCAAGVGGGAILGRSKLLHWGATAEEVADSLPGDSVVPDPHLTATRAITIHRRAAEVWSWIAQLGQGRGGFYSYERLENLIGAHIHNADGIVTSWQDVHVGDEVHLAPEVALSVVMAEVPVALVLRGGVPMGSIPSPYDFSWAFVLREESEGVTRLVVRERYRYLRGWARFIVEPVAIVSFVMTHKMLRGIKDRAEGTVATASVEVSHATRELPHRLPDARGPRSPRRI